MRNAEVSMHNLLRFFCILLFALCASSCSLPSLESAECGEARTYVKQFYSWYIGTDADERNRHPEIYEKYVSRTFPFNPKHWERDPYLLTNDFPNTFRLGTCKAADSDHVEFQVLLLWRDDMKSTQKGIRVEAIKTTDRWLISKVSE